MEQKRLVEKDPKPNKNDLILIAGGGGFIGGHLVKSLKSEGHWVRGVDVKQHEYSRSPADEFLVGEGIERTDQLLGHVG